MKYAAIITYTTGERTGATFCAESMADAWGTVFELFDKSALRAVELAEILTQERADP